MSIIDLNTHSCLESEIKNSDDIIIDFYATWCRPCMDGAHLFESRSLDPKYLYIKFAKVDIDKLGEDIQLYPLTSIPTLIRYKNNIVYKKECGLNDEVLDRILS